MLLASSEDNCLVPSTTQSGCDETQQAVRRCNVFYPMISFVYHQAAQDCTVMSVYLLLGSPGLWMVPSVLITHFRAVMLGCDGLSNFVGSPSWLAFFLCYSEFSLKVQFFLGCFFLFSESCYICCNHSDSFPCEADSQERTIVQPLSHRLHWCGLSVFSLSVSNRLRFSWHSAAESIFHPVPFLCLCSFCYFWSISVLPAQSNISISFVKRRL